MGCRGVIWFRGNDSDGNEQGTCVFAHDGGDPRFVARDLKEALDRANTPRESKIFPGSFYDDSWKAGRPGYSASLLCGVDPPNFQVDTYWLTSGGRFYADLEWLYLVAAEVVDGKWDWLVEVRQPDPSFWGEPTLANTRVRHRRNTVEALASKYLPKKPRVRRPAVGVAS